MISLASKADNSRIIKTIKENVGKLCKQKIITEFLLSQDLLISQS